MNLRGKASISTYACSDQPIGQVVTQFIEEGWKGIEIMAEGSHGELLGWSKERIDELRNLGMHHDIRWSIHAPVGDCNLAASGAEDIREAVENVLHTMYIAEELGCQYVVVHPGEVSPEEMMKEGYKQAAFERILAFLQVVLKASSSSSMMLALENVPPYPGLLGSDAEFLEQLLMRMNSPRLRLIYDCGHAHLNGEGQAQAMLRRMLPHSIGLHLSDNRGIHDDHLGLGQGTVPLQELMQIIESHNYTGSIVVETGSVSYAHDSMAWLLYTLRNQEQSKN